MLLFFLFFASRTLEARRPAIFIYSSWGLGLGRATHALWPFKSEAGEKIRQRQDYCAAVRMNTAWFGGWACGLSTGFGVLRTTETQRVNSIPVLFQYHLRRPYRIGVSIEAGTRFFMRDGISGRKKAAGEYALMIQLPSFQSRRLPFLTYGFRMTGPLRLHELRISYLLIREHIAWACPWSYEDVRNFF